MKPEELFIGGWYRNRYTDSVTQKEVVHDFKVSEIRKLGKDFYAWCEESGCVCGVEKVEPLDLTTDLLERNGWETKDKIVWYKKGPIRLGWYPSNKTLITGYYTFPRAVCYVHQLMAIQRLLGLEEIKL